MARARRRTPVRHLIGMGACLVALAAGAAGSQTTEQRPEWNRPVEPFRIVGNIHYVGTNELATYLIATPAGHILLDGGLPESAPLIEASIVKLGFRLADVKVLLNSQAHFDHVGSLARLKQATGGRVMVMEGDAELVARGGRGDFAFGDEAQFPAVPVDRVLKDGDTVALGGTTLTALATPGHTRGCTTWTMSVEEDGRRLSVVFPGSTTVNPPVRLVHDPSYPGIVQDFERTFRVLEAQSPDVFLAAHTGFFRLEEKRARQVAGAAPNPFIDPDGYRAFVARGRRAFEERLSGERKQGRL